MNVLLEAIEKLTEKELIPTGLTKRSGLVLIEDAIEILSELEVAVRNECECTQLAEEVFNERT